MKVCFFIGSYTVKEERLLKKILQLQNVEVIECREDIHNFLSFITANVKLFFRHFKLDYDVMIIPWWGIFTFPLAKIICRKPIIYWSNLSIYHTIVNDRKLNPNSLKAKLIHFAEKFACKNSTIIITESHAQINHLVNEYNLDKRKFRVSINGVDETIFSPLTFKPDEKILNVLFFGSFVPAHGVETIIESAKILSGNDEIVFDFCGDGPTKKSAELMVEDYKLKNVNFLGFIEQQTLPSIIAKSDICLGIFGTSKKAANVVANKILQILASKKPLVTMYSAAMTEIKLEDSKNCLLVPAGDPKKLSEAILFLKNNPEKRKQIAENGYQLYKENLSMEITGKNFLKIIEEVKT
jgi:glycosyltransferase involved in cell wall biosynthesis